MRHILLTWNPGPENEESWTPEAWQSEMVRATAEGWVLPQRWSVGLRVRGIDPGDRAYLYRQGVHGRGVIAIGEITSTPYPDDDWRGTGGSAQYVDIDWLQCLSLDEAVTVEELQDAVADFPWGRVQSSGWEVPDEKGVALAKLWDEHVGILALPDLGGGAGFGSAKNNRIVEDAAIDFVQEWYEAEHWKVTSVERDNVGWDLTVVKDGDEKHIEVKGVAGPAPRFFLTADEHRMAIRDLNWTLVAVTNALTDDPTWYEIDRSRVVEHADPVVYRVQLDSDEFDWIEEA